MVFVSTEATQVLARARSTNGSLLTCERALEVENMLLQVEASDGYIVHDIIVQAISTAQGPSSCSSGESAMYRAEDAVTQLLRRACEIQRGILASVDHTQETLIDEQVILC